MTRDIALQTLRDDAKSLGMSLRKYQRAFGIMLLPAQLDRREREVILAADSRVRSPRPAQHCRYCDDKGVVVPTPSRLHHCKGCEARSAVEMQAWVE